jgi:hypothetical protein
MKNINDIDVTLRFMCPNCKREIKTGFYLMLHKESFSLTDSLICYHCGEDVSFGLNLMEIELDGD